MYPADSSIPNLSPNLRKTCALIFLRLKQEEAARQIERAMLCYLFRRRLESATGQHLGPPVALPVVWNSRVVLCLRLLSGFRDNAELMSKIADEDGLTISHCLDRQL